MPVLHRVLRHRRIINRRNIKHPRHRIHHRRTRGIVHRRYADVSSFVGRLHTIGWWLFSGLRRNVIGGHWPPPTVSTTKHEPFRIFGVASHHTTTWRWLVTVACGTGAAVALRRRLVGAFQVIPGLVIRSFRCCCTACALAIPASLVREAPPPSTHTFTCQSPLRLYRWAAKACISGVACSNVRSPEAKSTVRWDHSFD